MWCIIFQFYEMTGSGKTFSDVFVYILKKKELCNGFGCQIGVSE